MLFSLFPPPILSLHTPNLELSLVAKQWQVVMIGRDLGRVSQTGKSRGSSILGSLMKIH